MPSILQAAKSVCPPSGTFKVETHRGDKKYPLTSVEVSKELGGLLLAEYKGALKVDVHNPSFTVQVDIREHGVALVFAEFIEGANGMPVGTAGRGMLLLSGGIDSPVAGHMMAKRGMNVDCLHFHSYPYTNMQAKEKVVELAHILAQYTGGTRLYTVSVTHIQEAIHEKCKPELMITLLRRFMFRIAERHAKRCGAQCLITGESLGQVASQTIEGMTSSNSVVEDLPVLRPLVGFDKNEIIERSVKMGAYETSILPFEDCCTVFLPDFPAIRPKLCDIEREENKLDVEGLIEQAFQSIEKIKI
jgi:thiamine biosynthesis protein ThiI